MITLISFCELPWWCVLLSWLLPFLLGLLLGWVLWAKYRRMLEDLEAEFREYKLNCKNTEEELSKCHSKTNEYVSEIALLKGRIRECEAENAELVSSSSTSSGGSEILSAAAGFVAGKATGKKGKENKSKGKDGSADKDKTNKLGFVGASGIAADKFAALKEDNLQVVEGIGPKMNEFLNKNDVVTWANLASYKADDIKKMLGKEGNKYRIIDPTTWPEQAALARDGKWEELIMLQKKLDTGRKNQTSSETDSKVEKLLVKMGILKRWKKDDLKAVEGIGPKIESLLHAGGIKTWRELSNTAVSKIQDILDKAGKRYALADPGTWPKQAGMAADEKWDELEKYQDYLNGGKEK